VAACDLQKSFSFDATVIIIATCAFRFVCKHILAVFRDNVTFVAFYIVVVVVVVVVIIIIILIIIITPS